MTPRYLIRIMDKLDLKTKSRTLKFFDLGIAYQCNYKCRMCFFWKDSPLSAANVLSIKQWKEVLRQLQDIPKAKDFIINFAGPGETFLREGIFELIRFAKALHLRTQVISNGSLINEELAKKIDDAGLEFLCLSLDSLDHEVHDLLRGVKGAGRKVFQAIEYVSKFAKCTKIGINTVISAVNIKQLPELTEWVQNDERISHINFQAITQPFSFTGQPRENWFEEQENRFLWPADKTQVNTTIDRLVDFKKRGYKIAENVRQLNIFRDYFLNPLLFIKNGRCNLGSGEVLIIDPAGNISMCSLLGQIDRFMAGKNLKDVLSSEETFLHKTKINKCRRNCHLVVSCYYQDE